MLLLVFERFTESARQVVVTAQNEARDLRHSQIDTEHVLLGLLAGRTPSRRVLNSFAATAKGVRKQLVQIVEPSETPVEGFMAFTPATKKVLELSLREALSLGHRNITPEHVLLALTHERDGVAMQLLAGLGADETAIRAAVLPLMPAPDEAGPQIPPASQPQIEISSDPVIRRLLTAAGDRALDDGRTEFGISDLLASVADDEEPTSALASLGVDVQAMREAIEREGPAEEPAG